MFKILFICWRNVMPKASLCTITALYFIPHQQPTQSCSSKRWQPKSEWLSDRSMTSEKFIVSHLFLNQLTAWSGHWKFEIVSSSFYGNDNSHWLVYGWWWKLKIHQMDDSLVCGILVDVRCMGLCNCVHIPS